MLIPRIPMSPTNMLRGFQHLQLPVQLIFATYINKAEGQLSMVVVINLEIPCFSYGPLYVTHSRVGTGRNLYIVASD